MTVERPTDRGEHRALHGLTRSLIANMVEGVTDGFEKRLEIQGVGYRAAAEGQEPRARAGLLPPGLDRSAEGIDSRCRSDRGHRAPSTSRGRPGRRDIRKRRPPEPYKGKGIVTAVSTSLRKVGKRV